MSIQFLETINKLLHIEKTTKIFRNNKNIKTKTQ